MTLFPTSLTKLKQPEENVHRSTTTPPSPPPVSSLTQLCLPTVAINDYPCAYLSLHCVLHSTSACLHKDTIPTILPSFCYVSFLVSTFCYVNNEQVWYSFSHFKNFKTILDLTFLSGHPSFSPQGGCSKTPWKIPWLPFFSSFFSKPLQLLPPPLLQNCACQSHQWPPPR